VERGWKAREERAGERVAGIRTYGLIVGAPLLMSAIVGLLLAWLLIG
jgi:hypothetical protein